MYEAGGVEEEGEEDHTGSTVLCFVQTNSCQIVESKQASRKLELGLGCRGAIFLKILPDLGKLIILTRPDLSKLIILT